MSRVVKNPKLDAMLDRAQGLKGDELIPYIEHYLEKHPYMGGFFVEDTEKKPDNHFHPSSDTLACKRFLFFKMSGKFALEPDVISPQLRRTFKIGQAVHSMVQAWLRDMSKYDSYPKMTGDEVPVVHEELNVRGSADAVLRFPGSTMVVLEIKTINSREFAKLTSPKSLHKLQLQVYMYILGHDKGIILYIEKDYPHDLKEFAVKAQTPYDIFRRWTKVKEAIVANDCSGLEFECKEGDKTWSRCRARNICRRVM